MKVVYKPSAKLDGNYPISVPVDHSDMNKFGTSEEVSFQLVPSEIQELVEWTSDFLQLVDQYLFNHLTSP